MGPTPGRRRHTVVFPESVGQMRLIAEPAVEGNLTQGHLAFREELGSKLNPASQHVGVRAQPNRPLEGP
jgi:hypothetical protein